MDPLRSDEITACPHRIALSRGAPVSLSERPLDAGLERRRREAERHRRDVYTRLRAAHPDAVVPPSTDATVAALRDGAPLVLSPRLPDDPVGLRRARVALLVRVGRSPDGYAYSPVVVKNNEMVEPSTTRRTLAATLESPHPAHATWFDGVGLRSTPSVTRVGLGLAHAWRLLESHGFADPSARVGAVDRRGRLWWFSVDDHAYARLGLGAYDRAYAERLAVLRGHERWRAEGGDFPTEPFWHRECLDCPFGEHCAAELGERDDVSLVRFTTRDQQRRLRDSGVATRASLARLDPATARLRLETTLEGRLATDVDRLDDLVYRARASLRGPLRKVDRDTMGCPRADVEVDVDMESYNDATYLWGATVTLRRDLPGVEPGYRAFVDWSRDPDESAVFADFWEWLREVGRRSDAAGASWRAYCFWAQAEDGAMNRAVASPQPGGPTHRDLEAFRCDERRLWIDVHASVRDQIQTDGPLGLKSLATHAGFSWRDPEPSGEASMLWFEDAVADGPSASASRDRILAYNEDDCRATLALREWLDGSARTRPHRDDPLE